MAKSAIGSALGFITTVTTRVMASAKGHEEAVLCLPEDTIKRLSDEFAQKLVAASQDLNKILAFVATVAVPAVTKFVAADAFGENNPAGIKFYLWPDFSRLFLGKTEENVPTANITIHTLVRSLLDAPIMDKLGERKIIKLTQFYALVKAQAHGEAGPLLTNGYANIAYIEDAEDNVWAVGAGWDRGRRGWSFGAGPVAGPRAWGAGRQVLSQVA